VTAPADALERWHEFVATGDASLLADVLADDVEFHSPAYWKARRGPLEAMIVLGAVATVFEDFRYEREWIDGRDWALEFAARIGDLQLKGVDLIRLDEGRCIARLEVMVRPPNAIAALREAMEQRCSTTSELASGVRPRVSYCPARSRASST
jgi:hypothetical protein